MSSSEPSSSRLNPLSQIPLIKSPFVQLPQAVTLPYDYAQLPPLSALPIIPSIPSLSSDESDSGAQRQARIAAARSRYEQWESESQARKIREARRIAPGFLDTGVTLLTPTIQSGLPEHKPVTQESAMDTTQEEDDYTHQFASLKF